MLRFTAALFIIALVASLTAVSAGTASAARPRPPRPTPTPQPAAIVMITSPARGSTVQAGTSFTVRVDTSAAAGQSIARVTYKLRYVGYSSFVDNPLGASTTGPDFALSYTQPRPYYQGYGDAWVFVEAFDSAGRLVATAGDTVIGGKQERHYVKVAGFPCLYACALP